MIRYVIASTNSIYLFMDFAAQTLYLSVLKSKMRHSWFNQMRGCIFAPNNSIAARHLAFHGFLWAIMKMEINLASEKKVQTFKICSTIFDSVKCGLEASFWRSIFRVWIQEMILVIYGNRCINPGDFNWNSPEFLQVHQVWGSFLQFIYLIHNSKVHLFHLTLRSVVKDKTLKSKLHVYWIAPRFPTQTFKRFNHIVLVFKPEKAIEHPNHSQVVMQVVGVCIYTSHSAQRK